MRTRFLIVVALAGMVGLAALTAATLQIKDLPAAVQKTVREQTANAELKSIARESEGGQTVYEVETIVKGRTRDLLIDGGGTVVEVEEEIALDAAPGPVQAALRSQGTVRRIEAVTRGTTRTYEAKVEAQGKRRSVTLDATGKVITR